MPIVMPMGVHAMNGGGGSQGAVSSGGSGTTPNWYEIGWRETQGVLRRRALLARIADLQGLLQQLRGPEATFLRWMVGRDIGRARWTLGSDRKGREQAEWEHDRTSDPIPDWMRGYLEKSQPARTTLERFEPSSPSIRTIAERQAAEKRRESLFPRELRPLGAQESLNIDQMATMGGYLGWVRAGAPTGVGGPATYPGRKGEGGLLSDAADWQKYWGEHERLSKSLFPTKAKMPRRWVPERQ